MLQYQFKVVSIIICLLEFTYHNHFGWLKDQALIMTTSSSSNSFAEAEKKKNQFNKIFELN